MNLRAVFGTAAVNDTTTPNDELWEQPTCSARGHESFRPRWFDSCLRVAASVGVSYWERRGLIWWP